MSVIRRYWIAGSAVAVQALALGLGQAHGVITWPLVLLMCGSAGVTVAAIVRELAEP